MQCSSTAGQILTHGETGLRSAFNSSVCHIDYKTEGKAENELLFSGVWASDLGIFRYESSLARRGSRAARHIALDRVDDFIVTFPQSSQAAMEQVGTRSTIEPDRFGLLSTARPFESSSGMDARFKGLLLRIRGPVLRQHVPGIDVCCARALTVNLGQRRLVVQLIDLILTEYDALTPAQLRQFNSMIVDAVVNATLAAPESEGILGRHRDSRYFTIYERAIDYVERHLVDNSLSLAQIAAHCAVSLRTLHAAFAGSKTTVSAYVRHRRLEECRIALGNPASRHKSITEIALSWGFNDPAHFSHAYKAAYGRTPREDRPRLLTRKP